MIPDSIKTVVLQGETIVSYAFEGVQKDIEYLLTRDVKTIGIGAFRGSSLSNINLLTDETGEISYSLTLTSIGEQAFANTKLTTASLPRSLLSIGIEAFADNTVLQRVIIPFNGSLTSIGNLAFFNCPDLRAVYTIPQTLSAVGTNLFSAGTVVFAAFPEDGDFAITYPSWNGDNEVYYSIAESVSSGVNALYEYGGVLYVLNLVGNKNYATAAKAMNFARGATYTLGDAQIRGTYINDKIGAQAFTNVYNTASVYISERVKTISASSFNNSDPTTVLYTSFADPVAEYNKNGVVFNACGNGRFLTYYSNVGAKGIAEINGVQYLLRGSVATQNRRAYVAKIIGTAPDDVHIMPSVNINDVELEVVQIGEHAAAGTHISRLTIPSTVVNYGGELFANSDNLTSVTIQAVNIVSLTAADKYPFENTISASADITPYDVSFTNIDTVGDYVLAKSRGVTFNFGTTLKHLGEHVLDSADIVEFTLPESLLTLGEDAFLNVSLETLHYNAKNITVAPQETVSTYESAFKNLATDSQTTVIIGTSVSAIPKYLFLDSAEIAALEFAPGSICTSIGERSFQGTGLTAISLPQNLMFLGEGAFAQTNISSLYYDVLNLTIYTGGTVNEGVASTFVSPFFSDAVDNELTVTFGTSITKVPTLLFANAENLKKVVFAEGNIVNEIGAYAFYNSGVEYAELPEHLTIMGQGAFKNAHYLNELYFDTIDMPEITSGTGAFTDAGSTASGGGITLYIRNANTVPTGFVSDGKFVAILRDAVTFGENLETIEAGAFTGQTTITTIELPKNLTYIGQNAFNGLTSLEEITVYSKHITGFVTGNAIFGGDAATATRTVVVTFESTAEYIPSHFIANAKGTFNIVIGGGVTEIGAGAFMNIAANAAIVIPDTVITIGTNAFSGQTSLTTLTIGRRTATIGAGAFKNNTALTTVNYNAEDATLTGGANAKIFEGSFVSGAVVNFGKTVIKIPAYLLKDIAKVETVGFTNALYATEIGAYAFYGTGIETVNFPLQLVTLGEFAFAHTDNLETVSINEEFRNYGIGALAYTPALTTIQESSNDLFSISDGVLYRTEGSEVAACAGYVTADIILDGITKIYDYAFVGRTYTSLTIQNSVIEDLTAGSAAFESTSFGSVTIEGTVERIPAYIFGGGSVTIGILDLESGIETIGAHAFEGVASVSSVIIPDSVTEIGENAFANLADLETLSIGTGLVSVGIGAGIVTIGNGAFENAVKLTSLTYNAANAADFTAENGVFANAGKDSAGVAVTIGDSVAVIPAYLFKNAEALTPHITSLDLGSGVTVIGAHAFQEARFLTSLDIPANVSLIGEYAFERLVSVATLTFSARASQLEIKSFAFENLSSLTAINLTVEILLSGVYTFAYSGVTNVSNIVTTGVAVIPVTTFAPFFIRLEDLAASEADIEDIIVENKEIILMSATNGNESAINAVYYLISIETGTNGAEMLAEMVVSLTAMAKLGNIAKIDAVYYIIAYESSNSITGDAAVGEPMLTEIVDYLIAAADLGNTTALATLTTLAAPPYSNPDAIAYFN
ncbi:MAG: leucine-rich repeat domain-containing protein [Christensenellaceae bacterium]|nr:leucine-rich repeat domain-containing protein [Christensenellaceae bacterium]